MTAPVEAQSLSSLGNLFANPPQYPRNPTHAVLEPLVLYIVKVPGSKDVFLTPLKPPAKASISLDAVQSCLYYLHVDTPEDELLIQSIVKQRESEETRKVADAASVCRKPLPSSSFSTYPATDEPHTPSERYLHYQPCSPLRARDPRAERYASRDVHLRLHTSNGDAASGVKRKPVGPRPLQQRPLSQDSASIMKKPVRRQPSNEAIDSAGSIIRQNELSIAVPSEPYTPIRHHSGEHEHGSESLTGPTSITLIRRDPSSSSQWNIGRVSFPVPSGGQGEVSRSIKVDLTTPGYRRFNKDMAFPITAAGVPSSADGLKSSVGTTSMASSAENTFTRLVSLEARQDPRPRQRRRSKSDESVRALKQGLVRSPAAKSRLQYAFDSPWHSMCSFSTGVDGRSLRCRHYLPTSFSEEADAGVNLAELRFNLPWMSLRPKDLNVHSLSERENRLSPATTKPIREHPFRKTVQQLRHKSWVADSTTGPGTQLSGHSLVQQASLDGDFEKLDLTLGQEKAGGGFLGNSAKLGKLIIDNEGLKMCDLVVATCMGIWWQHYSPHSVDV